MRTSTKYLLAGAAGAANTANAIRPFARTGYGSIPSFFAGWLTSELPLYTIGWQAATAGVVGWRRGLGSPGIKGALALSAASWAALGAIHVQANRADRVFQTALDDALGSLPPGTLGAAEPSPLPPLPFPQVRKRYGVDLDVAYGEAGPRNHLDIWHRGDLTPDAGAPVLLQIHGGAWMVGTKEQQGGPLMAHLAENGWVCVAINYRLSPRATWPDHIVDVKRAIAWIRGNITRYGGDPTYIAVTGGSAGGHLSSLAALTPNEPEFQPGFEAADTAVQAAVPLYGVYDFLNRHGTGRADMSDVLERIVIKTPEGETREVWDRASPVHWVNRDAPPFMVIHGTNDSLVPVGQARSFVDDLRASSANPVVYAELPGAQHAFDVFGVDPDQSHRTGHQAVPRPDPGSERPAMTDIAPTVIVARRVTPGCEQEFRQWNSRLQAVAAAFPGHLGSEAQPPGTVHPDEWMIVYHFASQPELDDWLSSQQRAALMDEGAHLLDGPVREQRIARPDSAAQAVTAVLSQHIRDDEIEAFQQAHALIVEAMGRFPGFLRCEFIEPVPGIQNDHVIVFSFTTRADLDRWLDSPERHEALKLIEPLIEGDRTLNIVDGFAGWFAPDATRTPPKVKQAVAVLIALFPTTLALSLLQRTLVPDVPWVPALLVSNVLGIAVLTWLLMPRVTRLLGPWLTR